MDTPLPPDVEEACAIIERLELHRRCLDEALADAYAQLLSGTWILGSGSSGDQPRLTRHER